jgi:hypothetical protein
MSGVTMIDVINWNTQLNEVSVAISMDRIVSPFEADLIMKALIENNVDFKKGIELIAQRISDKYPDKI